MTIEFGNTLVDDEYGEPLGATLELEANEHTFNNLDGIIADYNNKADEEDKVAIDKRDPSNLKYYIISVYDGRRPIPGFEGVYMTVEALRLKFQKQTNKSGNLVLTYDTYSDTFDSLHYIFKDYTIPSLLATNLKYIQPLFNSKWDVVSIEDVDNFAKSTKKSFKNFRGLIDCFLDYLRTHKSFNNQPITSAKSDSKHFTLELDSNLSNFKYYAYQFNIMGLEASIPYLRKLISQHKVIVAYDGTPDDIGLGFIFFEK